MLDFSTTETLFVVWICDIFSESISWVSCQWFTLFLFWSQCLSICAAMWDDPLIKYGPLFLKIINHVIVHGSRPNIWRHESDGMKRAENRYASRFYGLNWIEWSVYSEFFISNNRIKSDGTFSISMVLELFGDVYSIRCFFGNNGWVPF